VPEEMCFQRSGYDVAATGGETVNLNVLQGDFSGVENGFQGTGTVPSDLQTRSVTGLTRLPSSSRPEEASRRCLGAVVLSSGKVEVSHFFTNRACLAAPSFEPPL